MGKSAGAAMLGSVVFTPPSSDNTAVLTYLGPSPLRRSDLSASAVLPRQWRADNPILKAPPFLIETHTGDRERSARAAIFLAEMETERARDEKVTVGAQTTARAKPVVLAVDSDTALIMQIAADGTLRVRAIGARAAEVLSLGKATHVGISEDRYPFLESGRSDVLLSGDAAVISPEGSVMNVQLDAERKARLTGSITSDRPITECLGRWVGNLLSGRDSRLRESRSRLLLRASVTTQNGNETELIDVEDSRSSYAYLTGTITTLPGTGCGLWQSRAFDFRGGQPENRLNLARYALAAGKADWAFALSENSTVLVQSARAIATTDAGDARSDASLFVQDVRRAQYRHTAQYVYRELGATHPVQIGGWFNGTFHIVPPGYSLVLEVKGDDREGEPLLCPTRHSSPERVNRGCR